MPFPTFDGYANFAASLVATAPSTPTAGTSLIVTAATGAGFPATPFDAVIWPAASQPTAANAEICRVTNISTDTFTIVRGPNPSSLGDTGGINRTVLVGDNIAANITLKALLDMQQVIHQGSYMTQAVTTSSTTSSPANTALAFQILTNDVYQFSFYVQCRSSTTSTNGLVFAVTGPTGATICYTARGTGRPGANVTTSTTMEEAVTLTLGTFLGNYNMTTATGSVHVTGTVTCSTTTGTVSLQFAAQVAATTVTVDRGSVAAFRVA